MKTIALTEKEIEELKSLYRNELEKALERVENITGILNKLTEDEITKELSNHSERKELDNENKPESGKKEIKLIKSKWGSFILDLLKSRNNPLNFQYIVDEAINTFSIPKENYKKVEYSINNSLFRLKTKDNKILSTNIPDKKGKYYGLKNWFEKTGELKEKYNPNSTENTHTHKTEEKKGRSKEPVWVPFVLDTVKEMDALIQPKILTNIAIEQFKIEESEYEKTRKTISSTLRDQATRRKRLKSYSIDGILGKFYGLPEWFDEKGELNEKYKEKISPILLQQPKQIKTTKKDINGELDSTILTPFVVNKIKEHGILMQSRTLTKLAMKEFAIPSEDYEKIRLRIATALSKHERESMELNSYIENGVKGKFYGLSEWFDKKGRIKKSYLNKSK